MLGTVRYRSVKVGTGVSEAKMCQISQNHLQDFKEGRLKYGLKAFLAALLSSISLFMPYVKIDQPMPKSVLWVFTFCVWAWVCYMSVYWTFKWMDSSASEVPTLSVPRVSEQLQAIKLSDLALALGQPTAPENGALSAKQLQAQELSLLTSRVRLMGVVYAQSVRVFGRQSNDQKAQQGAALLSLDQQAAKPYKVGDEVEPGLYLLAIEPKGVKLGSSPTGPVTLSVELPALKGI